MLMKKKWSKKVNILFQIKIEIDDLNKYHK